jgi:ribosomal protein L37E
MKHVFLVENERHAKAIEREQLKTTCRRCGGPKQLEATWYCRECGVTVALERRAARHRARKEAANAV